MKRRKMTDTFVQDLPLKVTAQEEKQLNASLEAARQVYNACLGEFLKRRNLMRQSKLYQKALVMPKGRRGKDATEAQKRQAKERSGAFREAAQAVGFTEYAAYAYTKQFTHSWLAEHLDSQVVRKIAKRAFNAVERFHYGTDRPCKKGKCKKKKKKCSICCKPRFKRKGEVNSIEGSSNSQSIRWIEGAVVWNASRSRKFQVDAIIDYDDPFIMHALGHRVKFVRLVRKKVGGQFRYYAQLSLEGKPLQRIVLGDNEIGLDIGPSTIATVGGDENTPTIKFEKFCAELENRQKEIRRLQRKIDRQRRANNPDNYLPNGQIKKGPKKWNKSARMKKTEAKLAEIQRKQVAHRKSLHGQMVNQIWDGNSRVKTEGLSYKSWQRNRRFSKFVQRNAPGMFVGLLRRRGGAIGGTVDEFGTYHTRFSQFDHTSGVFYPENSNLNVRKKVLDDGTAVHRDLYSAFLAWCYDPETDMCSVGLTDKRWPSVGSLLQAGIAQD